MLRYVASAIHCYISTSTRATVLDYTPMLPICSFEAGAYALIALKSSGSGMNYWESRARSMTVEFAAYENGGIEILSSRGR